jgi:hypothetical protein
VHCNSRFDELLRITVRLHRLQFATNANSYADPFSIHSIP